MPDGLTHIAVGYIGALRWLKGGPLALFLLGSIIPDILLRGGRLLFLFHPQRDFIELYLTPLHTPIGCVFICLALAQVFHCRIRRAVFMILFSGCLAHLLLDMLQLTIKGFGPTVQIIDGYHWLYPISWFDFQVGIFWAGQAPYALLFLVPISVGFFVKGRRVSIRGMQGQSWRGGKEFAGEDSGTSGKNLDRCYEKWTLKKILHFHLD